jgi:transposase
MSAFSTVKARSFTSKTESTAQAIGIELAKALSCRQIVFETGRMAPILFHGLSHRGFPWSVSESRQAYQALKSLATHKTDRNDARGLAHLARTGFFKPLHVKSLSAQAVRSLIMARKFAAWRAELLRRRAPGVVGKASRATQCAVIKRSRIGILRVTKERY